MTKKKMEKVVQVQITDLEREFGLQGRDIRRLLRKAGLKAPETGIEGFGPRARYQWTEGSKELKQVRSILQEFVSSKGNARRSSRTKQEMEPEEESEELEQDEMEDDDEEEDN